MPFYAVLRGRHPGVYQTWAEASIEVQGFQHAAHKKFDTQEEADAWMAAGQAAEVAAVGAGATPGTFYAVRVGVTPGVYTSWSETASERVCVCV